MDVNNVLNADVLNYRSWHNFFLSGETKVVPIRITFIKRYFKKINPDMVSTHGHRQRGASGALPPHFMFGPRDAAYTHYCI